MPSPYSVVLRRPGALRMTTTGFVARLPMSMLGLGEVLLVSSQTGSYALAGVLSATGALANALVGPAAGRATDRYGQHRVLPLLVGVHVVALLAFVVLVMEGAPTGVLLLSVTVSGASFPNLGALVRARWAFLLAGQPPLLRTAFAWESVLDEVIFVAGPPLATVLAVAVVDYGALAAVAAFLVVGTVLFVRSRATEPPSGGGPAHHEGSALRYPGVAAISVAFLFLGGLFGSFEVVTVAFADEQGVRAWTGLLLGLYALASGVAGIVLGGVRVRAPLHRQLLVFSALLAVVTLPFPFLHSPWLVGAGCLVAGLAVSPVLISGFALVERLVPNARMTEGLVWTNTGIGIGVAVSAALAGVLVDAHGASVAYALCAGSALLTFLVVLAARGGLERAWRASHDVDDAEPAR